jgi:hypothetical protein
VSWATIVVASSLVWGQASEISPAYEHLKVLEPLVGEYAWEGKLEEPMAGVPAGQSARLAFSFHWILNRSVLRWDWKITSAGKEVVRGIEHMGWNTQKGRIVSAMFATDGEAFSSEWSVENGRFISHFTGAQPDGKESRGDVILTVADKDTLIWKAVGWRVADTAPVDSLEYRCTRQTPQRDMPEVAQAAMDYYVGQWTGQWKQGELGGTFRMIIQWVPGNDCTINNYEMTTPDGVIRGTLLSGWDPEKKQIVDTAYESNGWAFEDRWDVPAGSVLEGSSRSLGPAGKVQVGKCRIDKTGPNEFTYTKYDYVEGGKKLTDLVAKYHRVVPEGK